MADYRLYGFAESGNAYKPALMLELCKADWECVHVDFFKGAARSPEFLEVNPMGEAPVLEGPAGPDGKRPRLTQSGAILTRLARELKQFGGATPEEDDEILRWILWDNHKLTNFTAAHRFMVRFAPEKVRNPDVIAFLDGRRKAAMKVLEAQLTKQDWVAMPDRATIADLSCCGYMFWLDQNGDSEAAYPAVSAWLNRIRALPGWKPPEALMKPAFAG